MPRPCPARPCAASPASTATDKCIQEKRKTITGEDILWAMQSLGFDSYVEPLKLYLQRYREVGGL